jgi:hypothetical protein
MIAMPQPANHWAAALVKDMQKRGVKTIAYIGFSDPWGDIAYNGLKDAAEKAGIKVVTNERYARADTSVTGQTLKIIAAKPDAVLVGARVRPGRCISRSPNVASRAGLCDPRRVSRTICGRQQSVENVVSGRSDRRRRSIARRKPDQKVSHDFIKMRGHQQQAAGTASPPSPMTAC